MYPLVPEPSRHEVRCQPIRKTKYLMLVHRTLRKRDGPRIANAWSVSMPLNQMDLSASLHTNLNEIRCRSSHEGFRRQ